MARMGKITGQLVSEYFNEKSTCTKEGCDHKRESTSMYCRQHENHHLYITFASLATTAVCVATTVILDALL